MLALANRWDDHHHPLRDGGHIKFWSINTLTKLFETEGFRVMDIRGAGRVQTLWKSAIMTGQKT